MAPLLVWPRALILQAASLATSSATSGCVHAIPSNPSRSFSHNNTLEDKCKHACSPKAFSGFCVVVEYLWLTLHIALLHHYYRTLELHKEIWVAMMTVDSGCTQRALHIRKRVLVEEIAAVGRALYLHLSTAEGISHHALRM